MGNIYRDTTLNNVSEQDIGKELKVAGWVENIRDHGGVSFIDLRDMYAVLQVVIRDPELLKGIKKEECISIEGVVEKRDEETYNPKIPSGTIELEAKKITMLGQVYSTIPFEVMTSKEVREDVRLKYRYLDLRNEKVKEQHDFPFTGYRIFTSEDDRNGIPGNSDTDSLCFFTGRRKRLYRTVQKIQGQVLCSATGTTAV